MKIKNEYIIIKNGEKQVKLHNLILDWYIQRMVANQVSNTYVDNLNMSYVFLKFDTAIEFNETSNINSRRFDIGIKNAYKSMEESTKNIIKKYTYKIEKGDKVLEIATESNITDLSAYNGKQIMTLGFCKIGYDRIYACVDVSNYGLYLDTDTTFEITRQDKFETDGELYSTSNIVNSPIHLAPLKPYFTNLGTTNFYFTKLISVGFGITKNAMDEEHTLLPYAEHIETGTDYMNILDEYTIEYINEGLFPATDLYPANDLYPARIIQEPVYPSEELYPSIELYPMAVPYQYMQLKYEIYKDIYNPVDTETYYIVSIPINGKRKIKMNINYERN